MDTRIVAYREDTEEEVGMSSEHTVGVPRRLLEELKRYLDQSSEEMVEVAGNGLWSRSMVHKLRGEVARYEGAIAVGDLAARRAGDPEPVSLDEVARESGISKKQISSDLGAMTKAARRLFGEPRWPFRSLDSGIGMTYLMPREIARWWLEGKEFWSEPSVEELARSQHVGSIPDPHDLTADLWDSDEERRQFIDDTYRARRA